MKKSKLCLLLISSMLLTGCQSSTNLTNEQLDEVSEYIGGKLIQYSSSYQEMLLSKDRLKEAEAETEEKPEQEDSTIPVSKTESTQMSSTGNKLETGSSSGFSTSEHETDTKAVTAAAVMGASSFDVKASDYGFYNSYPKNGAKNHFVLNASSGKKLLVVKVKLTNTGSSAKKLDTANHVFKCKASGDKLSGEALVSLLKNDIHFMNTTVKAGKSVNGILVFEVSKNASLTDLSIRLSGEAGTAELALN